MVEVDIVGERPALLDVAEVERTGRVRGSQCRHPRRPPRGAFVDSAGIAQLNLEHRAKDAPTDVLSFPIDGAARCRPGHASSATS